MTTSVLKPQSLIPALFPEQSLTRDIALILAGSLFIAALGQVSIGAPVPMTLQTLGVIPSFSRPSVSNDNPYAESFFKTLKYCPAYPQHPFKDLLAAREWVGTFMHWYNEEHRHSGIKFVTPAQRHAGLDTALLNKRDAVYAAAKAKHPERWSGATRDWQPILVAHLNPDKMIVKESNQEEVYQELKLAA